MREREGGRWSLRGIERERETGMRGEGGIEELDVEVEGEVDIAYWE